MSLSKGKNTREQLLKNVQKVSFAVDEARLYLDTHPDDRGAKRYFDRYNNARKKAISEFEMNYGPLLADNINAEKDGWTWIDEPFPWNEGVK